MNRKILLIPGDGIGKEIIHQVARIIEKLQRKLGQSGIQCQIDWADAGGSAYELTGHPLPEQTLSKAKQSDGILFGAVGGPQWDDLPRHLRPEQALLALRKELDLFANLRPALLYPELVSASSLKPEVVSGLDIMIVRELTGGIYFGQPRGVQINQQGEQEGFNTYRYTESEIRRLAQNAFQIAMKRNKKLCSVDKANVLEVTQLWRDIFIDESTNYPEVELSHMYVDNASMQLVRNPKQFDVIATGNMFGDILSDTAAMLTGSIGMLPSASLNSQNQGMYEPVHGSAPDIAGSDTANPLATILSLALLLRYSLDAHPLALLVEKSVSQVVKKNYRTADIMTPDGILLGTTAMTDKVLQEMDKLI